MDTQSQTATRWSLDCLEMFVFSSCLFSDLRDADLGEINCFTNM